MEGAVLLDDSATVNANNLAVGEDLTDDAHGLCIEVGLRIGRYQYRTVDDELVGIGGWETVTVNDVIVDH